MRSRIFKLMLIGLLISGGMAFPQITEPVLNYRIIIEDPGSRTCHMKLTVSGCKDDTVYLALPNWMPGYYQLMHYADNVGNVEAVTGTGDPIPVERTGDNSWRIIPGRQSSFSVTYDVRATRRFVANSFLDSTHAYIVPANNFLYLRGRLNLPVQVEIVPGDLSGWTDIATGLEPVDGSTTLFTAVNFDILYDCPILIGDLEELPSFEVRGIEHRFIGYRLGDFDHDLFLQNLNAVVSAAVSIFDDIPYDRYTFIGIGPGYGGIEHLNNTTISFSGDHVRDEQGMTGMMNFIGHEYFHHYNVKRIRPFELGPFDYERENRTTQLWISEGLTVYYEYVITKMAGLMEEQAFLEAFAHHITAVENNPGRLKQSLVQSSYYTWEDGPFGRAGETISYYEKGPLVGLILDLAIRHASGNERSLDDVMRFLYRYYYKELDRGFTDAEFQAACEKAAGALLTRAFEYVYTTREMDYATYLHYAGLDLAESERVQEGKHIISYHLKRTAVPDSLQSVILTSWLRE